MGKGQRFEREFCKRLSLWWTGGRRDDVFWRTVGSGAWVTMRKKRGMDAPRRQWGDVVAVDPEGEFLTEHVAFELKRGYGYQRFQDVFNEFSPLRRWFAKGLHHKYETGRDVILVLSHRTQQMMVITQPLGGRLSLLPKFAVCSFYMYIPDMGGQGGFTFVPIVDFFETVEPGYIRQIYEGKKFRLEHDQTD